MLSVIKALVASVNLRTRKTMKTSLRRKGVLKASGPKVLGYSFNYEED